MESWFECELSVFVSLPPRVSYSLWDATDGNNLWLVFQTELAQALHEAGEDVFEEGPCVRRKSPLPESNTTVAFLASFCLKDREDPAVAENQCKAICLRLINGLETLSSAQQAKPFDVTFIGTRVQRERCISVALVDLKLNQGEQKEIERRGEIMESWFKCVLKLEFRIPATATYKSRDTFEGRDFCKGFKDRVEFCLAESGGDYALECLERDERKQLNICYAGDLLKAKISFRPHEGTGDLMAEETRCEEVRQQAWQEVLAYLFPVLKEYDVQAILTGFSVCRETCIQVSAGVPEEYPQEQKDEAKQWKVGLNAS